MSRRLWRSVYVFAAVLFFFAAVNLAHWLSERGHKPAYRAVVGVPFPMAGWGGEERVAWFSPAGACLNAAVALGAASAAAWLVRQETHNGRA